MTDTYHYIAEGPFYHRAEKIETGDTVELSGYTYRLHAALFEPVDAETDEADEADESDESADEADGEAFDAESFVDDHWRSVKDAIEDGAADGHLADVLAAEEARDGGGRKSVVGALESREE